MAKKTAAAELANGTLRVQMMSPTEIKPYERNAKIHTPEQVEKIAHQISEFGFDQPIVVDKDLVIIKGHGRREAALHLKLAQVPVVVAAHLTKSQARAARIADNKVAEGGIDQSKLHFEIGELHAEGFNLKLTGFSLPEIGKMMDLGAFSVGVDHAAPGADQTVETPVGGAEGSEAKAEAPGASHAGAEPQFIVAVRCKNETEMGALYTELQGRGFNCKLIT